MSKPQNYVRLGNYSNGKIAKNVPLVTGTSIVPEYNLPTPNTFCQTCGNGSGYLNITSAYGSGADVCSTEMKERKCM
jgi:hypothetical protein